MQHAALDIPRAVSPTASVAGAGPPLLPWGFDPPDGARRPPPQQSSPNVFRRLREEGRGCSLLPPCLLPHRTPHDGEGGAETGLLDPQASPARVGCVATRRFCVPAGGGPFLDVAGHDARRMRKRKKQIPPHHDPPCSSPYHTDTATTTTTTQASRRRTHSRSSRSSSSRRRYGRVSRSRFSARHPQATAPL